MMALAPMISVLTAVATLALVPFGDTREDGIFGADYGLYGIDVSIGILYMFAFGALALYGFMLGGWASGSKYSFLGAMRSAAQLISYEVALGLSLLGIVMTAGTLSLTEIVEHQDTIWFIVPQFVGFLIFLVAGFAETARAPFDLPEADAEIVAGYNTEYGGMRFGAFFMAEYMHIIVFGGLCAALFLGGWHGPGPAYLDPLWVIVKMVAIVLLFIWVRATLPRLRYDQLMSFGWKVLLPLATLNALVTAIVVVATGDLEPVRRRDRGPARARARRRRRRLPHFRGDAARAAHDVRAPVRGAGHDRVPGGEDARLPALARQAQAAPVRGDRAREVRRAARCAPRHARPTASASSRPRTRPTTRCRPASATPPSTRST